MLIHPLHKLVHFRKNTPDGIVAIYVNSALRTFAISLVGIFMPVFIFLETQKIFGQEIYIGLYGVITYYFILRLTFTLFLIPVAKIISKIGFRWSFFVANILLVIVLGLLSLVEKNFWLLPIISIIQGLQAPFYWLSYRSLFAREGVLSNIGREVGFSAISTQLAGIAGPTLGGVIITLWGFPALFDVALLVVMISGIPFFFMSKHEHKFTVTFSDVVNWLKNKTHRNEELSFLGRNIDGTVYALVWPVFVYLLLGNFEEQGLVASLGLVASAVMVYVAGRAFDKKRSNRIFNFGVIANSIMWVLRGLVKNMGQLIFVETSAHSVSPFYWVTFDSMIYERAREKDEEVILFMVGRTLMVSLGVFVVLLTLFIIAKYEFRFWVMWILALTGVLSTKYMWEEKSDR